MAQNASPGLQTSSPRMLEPTLLAGNRCLVHSPPPSDARHLVRVYSWQHVCPRQVGEYPCGSCTWEPRPAQGEEVR